MTPDLYDFEKMKARFSRYLIEKGMRKTTERFMILDHICRIQGHFHVSRASIYNTIETLMDAHIVIRHQFTAQLVQYELHDAAATHHHAICSYCGAVKEIKDERLSDGVSRLRTPRFTYEYHSLYLYGICSKCKFRMAHRSKKSVAT